MPEPEEDDNSSGRPFWSGTITFGLVSIPVNLFPANRSSRVSLRMLSRDGLQLKRRYYSSQTGRDLSPEEIVRGYEIEKDRYVIVTDDELERLAPEKTRDIDLRRFVPEEQLPPVYFERGYFLAPAGASVKAYRLLAETMKRTGRAGIATFVMRGKEYLVAILSDNGILRAETLRFADEIRSPETVGLPSKPDTPAKLVKTFEKAIESASAEELPREQIRNENAERMLKLIEKKRKRGEDMVGSGKVEDGADNVEDIVSLLQRTLGQVRRQPKREQRLDDLHARSRSELYERAKQLNIPGRSSMSKQQLVEAIRKAA